jgi:molybdate transport system substrate-binding protein
MSRILEIGWLHRLRRLAACIGASVLVAVVAIFGAASARAGELLIFAAASQREALDMAIAAYRQISSDTVKVSYLSSSVLARQIERGAPADLFISANPKWMDYLQTRGLIDPSTRTDMFRNRLVLVTAQDGPAGQVDLKNGFDLAGLVSDGRLAVGDPDHVPAGLYAREAMQSLGVWKSVESRLARAENVRAALALVARGEASYGIVYTSDAVADKTVKVVGTFPEDSHSRIVYPAAVIANSKNPHRARAFLDFLNTPKADKIYRQFGFSVLGSVTN